MTWSESQFIFDFESANDCIPTWPVRDIDGLFSLQGWPFLLSGEQILTTRGSCHQRYILRRSREPAFDHDLAGE